MKINLCFYERNQIGSDSCLGHPEPDLSRCSQPQAPESRNKEGPVTTSPQHFDVRFTAVQSSSSSDGTKRSFSSRKLAMDWLMVEPRAMPAAVATATPTRPNRVLAGSPAKAPDGDVVNRRRAGDVDASIPASSSFRRPTKAAITPIS